MRARFATLPTRTLVAIALGAVVVYAVASWFLLVAPKRAEATSLAEDVAAAELRLADARAKANRPQAAAPTGARVSDVLSLAKAMPASADQPGLVLELDRLARSTGVKLGSITPRDPVATPGSPTAIPVVVTAEGSYRQITRFVRRARELVRFRGGKVRATGRLFTVQGVELAESNARKFPFVDATITLNAFVYDGPIVAETPAPAPAGEDADATPTGTSAAGATS
jgi:Tfp pilus assembly protein PilO